MHYHLEILMPPTDDVPAAVAKALAGFEYPASHLEYRQDIEPRPDWLLVTVDYHS